MPQRIQRKRTAGWKMPAGAVVVDRTTKWGNPFRLGDESRGLVRFGPKHLERFGREWDYEGRISGPGTSHHLWFSKDDVVETYVRWATREEVVELYRLTLTDPTPGMRMAWPSRGGRFLEVTVDDIRRELAGKDLACFCRLDEVCHADALLSLAAGNDGQVPDRKSAGAGSMDPTYLNDEGTWVVDRTARKAHRCTQCHHEIRPGERYRLSTAHPGGELGLLGWDRMKTCQRCAARYQRPIEIPGCTCLALDDRIRFEDQAPDPACPSLAMHWRAR